MIKHSRTLAAIAASSLLAAFAAQANKGAEYHASKHHEGHKFFITGGATYLEPSLNNIDYVNIISTPPAVTATPSINGKVVEPGFNWGYFLAAGYKMSHHYDIQASWAQFDSRQSASTSAESVVDTLRLVTSNQQNFALDSGETGYAHAIQNINYSVFDANLGQYHDITEMLKARIFAGVRYAQIDATLNNNYAFTGSSVQYYDQYSSSFNGVGPEVGLDLEYKVWEKLGVVGRLGAAFLVGQQEASSYVYGDFGQTNVEADTLVRLLPAIDAKLGLNWEIPVDHHHYAFAIEGGYQVAYYWDVIDQLQFPIETNQITHNYSNYGMMGPYLNLTAMF